MFDGIVTKAGSMYARIRAEELDPEESADIELVQKSLSTVWGPVQNANRTGQPLELELNATSQKEGQVLADLCKILRGDKPAHYPMSTYVDILSKFPPPEV
jgi:hypothetical protein